jgi:hypothetical protein
MKVSFLFPLVSIVVTIMMASCSSPSSHIPKNDEQSFNSYWNQGKAEVSTFTLDQSRYGSQHDGTVALVFVTEDFSRKREVKLDEPKKHSSDDVKVMKCNMTKEFVTGIYQYNMMSSVFSPLDYQKDPHSLKLVASTQEWCGQTFLQANWKGYRYETQQYSYVEEEGDTETKLINTWLEDEIWTKIRIAPDMLPIGKIKMVPSAFYLRLTHTALKVYEALTTIKEQDGQYHYTIQYPELGRTMEINFEKVFPHKIFGWKETYGKNETTTATFSKSLLIDYWNHNHPEDEALRDSLHLAHG